MGHERHISAGREIESGNVLPRWYTRAGPREAPETLLTLQMLYFRGACVLGGSRVPEIQCGEMAFSRRRRENSAARHGA